MSEVRNRKQMGAPKIARIGANGLRDQYRNTGAVNSSWFTTIAFAPFDVKPTYWSTIFIGYLMEFIGTLLLTFAAGLATNKATGDPLISGAVLGAVIAGTFYLALRWRLHEKNNHNELPRHLGWTVTFAHMFVLRTGLVTGLGYLLVQTAAALCSGGILQAIGTAKDVLPAADITPAFWGLEFLGSFLIPFVMLYNLYLGGAYKNEELNMPNAHLNAAMVRFVLTGVLFSYGSYLFEPTLYLTAHISQCEFMMSGCPYNSWPFYVFYPIVGAFAAGVVYLVFMVVYTYCTASKYKLQARRADAGDWFADEGPENYAGFYRGQGGEGPETMPEDAPPEEAQVSIRSKAAATSVSHLVTPFDSMKKK